MKNFTDRVPTNANRKKITFEAAPGIGINYGTVEFADTPTVAGTNLNREAYMALQGFNDKEIVFGATTITETNGDGDTRVTTFGTNTIVEVFTSGATTITKTTTFNIDGTISEVIS